MIIETQFELGKRIHLKATRVEGIVRFISVAYDGMISYQLRYFDPDNKPQEVWAGECELEDIPGDN